MQTRLSTLQKREPRLAEMLLKSGRVTGEFVNISVNDFVRAAAPFRHRRAHCFGLGDLVAVLAWPVQRLLRRRTCPKCSARRARLNRLLRLCCG